MTDNGWPSPPGELVESQRRNLARANAPILHLARRLQIVAHDWLKDEQGVTHEVDKKLGGPFAPAPLYLEMAITLSEKPELTAELLSAIKGVIPH
jgi:hypothetical protein